MVDTLKSLAGATFKVVDVITALHEPIPAEQLILDRYVFLPHARSGIAAALSEPFAWSAATQAKVEMKVPVIDDRGGLDAEMTMHVNGPAQVTEIDARQVIRQFPKTDAPDAEVDDLVHVEFDRPDLPWMFTPTGPDAAGRLVPWITLVVTERKYLEWGEQRGATRRAKIRRDQLQPLGDAWAWAHAQVMGAKLADPTIEPTFERRLSEANAAHNLSRLVCPRHLRHQTHYVACVVPTFRVGADTGLGLTPSTTKLEPTWGTATDFGTGDPAAMVELPVYYTWSFATGEDGNFQSLAHRLKPAVAPPGVGRRRVDASRPWAPLALDGNSPGAEIVVEGPVVSPQKPAVAPEERWPTEVQQQWAPAVSDALIAKLNNPDRQAHQPQVAGQNPEPLVGPPLYGSNHARQPRLETLEPAASAQPQWFRQLNIDPRNRIVGGLGTRVVQAEQEDLMAAAWNQVIGIDAANRALRFAQLALHTSASLHRRHLARLGDAAILAVTERVHAKVLDAPQRSVWSSLTDSSLPTSVMVGAFRRLTAVRGRVARSAVAFPGQRAIDVAALTVRGDRLTADWVRQYANPDGVTRVGALAQRRLTPQIAAQLDPSGDPETLIRNWSVELATPAPPDALTPDNLGRAQLPPVVNLGAELVVSVTRRLFAVVPSLRVMREDAESAITGAAHATLLRVLLDPVAQSGTGAFELSRFDAKRLELEIARDARDPNDALVSVHVVRAFTDRAIEIAQQHQHDVPFDEFNRNAARLREFVSGNAQLQARDIQAGMMALASKVVLDDQFLDHPRARVDVPALTLVSKLDPAITVPRRVHARLTASGRNLPGWLRPDWFADQRVEPVMAHPRFRYPMYEPLQRYDREWMIPGLGLINKPDMATLLETNNRFVEAYLVGLNHEMGRELLWREFPTDQRGTYFHSFWTGRKELVADLHERLGRPGS